MTKEKVEAEMRLRNFPEPFNWRDNDPQTYQFVYDYLMKHQTLRYSDLVEENHG